MPNKYTEALLTQPNTDVTGYPTLTELESILFKYELSPYFWDDVAEFLINDYEGKANLYCLFAAMSDEEIESIISSYKS